MERTMTPARAAEVLRNIPDDLTLPSQDKACFMGAESLELMKWIDGQLPNGESRVGHLYRNWPTCISFLDFARAEWERERENAG